MLDYSIINSNKFGSWDHWLGISFLCISNLTVNDFIAQSLLRLVHLLKQMT